MFGKEFAEPAAYLVSIIDTKLGFNMNDAGEEPMLFLLECF